MCCIFTCCGWMIDLVQRLWTFTMSCCISSAVCCSLLTASMSGIALGYNYSLAEYIDLKETNVSVYLKRGVFDDDIADDMEWRRSGHLPISGHIKEDNLMTGAPADDSSTLRSGRRLDDSIYESNDRYNFEGSLMKLTAKPLDASSTASSFEPLPLHEIVEKYPSNSLDQLKAVQSVINMRKMAAVATRTTKQESMKTPYMDERNYPHFNVAGVEGSNRRAMNFDVPPYLKTSTFNSLRKAVPDDSINNPKQWMLPKLQPTGPDRFNVIDYVERFTYPSPVTPRSGPLRPTRPKPMRPSQTLKTNPTHTTRKEDINLHKSLDEEMDSFKSKYNMMDKIEPPSSKEDFMKKIKTGPKPSDEDYEEEIRGIPLRRKRNSKNFKRVNTSPETNIKPSMKEFKPNKVHETEATKFYMSGSTTTKRPNKFPFDNLEDTLKSKSIHLIIGKGEDINQEIKTTKQIITDRTTVTTAKLAIVSSNKLGNSNINIDMNSKKIIQNDKTTAMYNVQRTSSQNLIKLLLTSLVS